jgi:hypothetical protein
MSPTGGGNEPTREFPEYVRGQAKAADPAADWPNDAAEIGRAMDTWPFDDAVRSQLVEPGSGRRFGRGLFWLAGIVGVVAVLLLGLRAVNLWPSFTNPFAQQQTDRSQPPLLRSIKDLSRYVAAEGNFQVVIDVQRNRQYVPDFLLNQRTLFVAAGSVESFVDFGAIPGGAITESPDHKSVEIKLPGPQLGKPNLDLAHSYVFAEQRGLINRVGDLIDGDPNRQQAVYRLAEERIAAAARDSGLMQRAQENTRKMLEGLLHSLGYATVTVTFTAA